MECYSRISISLVLSMSGWDEHFQVVSDDMFIEHMVHKEQSDEERVVPEEETLTEPLTCWMDGLWAKAMVKRYALGRDISLASLQKGICTLQRPIFANAAVAHRQLTLGKMMRSNRK